MDKNPEEFDAYFARPLRQRVKVDMDLAQLWEYSARYNGAEEIKKQVALAKRTSTVLSKSMLDFAGLTVAQKHTFKAAALELHNHANNLQTLAVWANDYLKFCIALRQEREEKNFQDFSAARWGDDDAAAAFEYSVMKELETNDGIALLGEWMHGQGRYQQVAPQKFILFSSTLHVPKTGASNYMRRYVYQTIRDTLTFGHTSLSGSGIYCHVGLHDYEAYLAHRREVATLTATTLSKFAAPGQP